MQSNHLIETPFTVNLGALLTCSTTDSKANALLYFLQKWMLHLSSSEDFTLFLKLVKCSVTVIFANKSNWFNCFNIATTLLTTTTLLSYISKSKVPCLCQPVHDRGSLCKSILLGKESVSDLGLII